MPSRNRMLPFRSYGYLVFIAGLAYTLASCMAASQRKSAAYYRENQQAISETRSLYDSLYLHQPFSAGFTDKSYKYYVMEVITDTVRYIYNTDESGKQLYETITAFRYDTTVLKTLALKMKAIKCLWLSKSSFYVDENRETVTFLSFKSAATDRPFVENKYYILIFLKHPITSPGMQKRIKKGDLVRIDELVYFMIGPKFR